MDIKPKTFDIQTWKEKNIYFRHILRQHSYTYPIALPVRDCCLSNFRNSVSNSSSSAKRFPPRCESLDETNTSHREEDTFLKEYPLH
jgi:hypothetical protein